MTKHIDVSEKMPESFKIVFGGDTHGYVQGYAYNDAKRYQSYIKSSKNVFWTCHGDSTDYMNPQDDRFKFQFTNYRGDIRTMPLLERADDQMNQFIDDWGVIGDKCLEVGFGNHEARIQNILNIPKTIAKAWGCDWGTPMTIMNLGAFKAFLWHPFRFNMNMNAGDPQQRYTNECMRIRRAMRFKPGSNECEVSVMSHIHKIRISPPLCRSILLLSSVKNEKDVKFKAFHPEMVKVKDPNTGIEYYPEDNRWFASTGAMYGYYVEGDYTYAETRNYDPTDLGWIEAEVKNGKFLGLREVEL